MNEMLFKLVLFVLGGFGNCWFWATYVNWLYSYPVADRILDRWRKIHDVAIFLIPVWLAWSLNEAHFPLLAQIGRHNFWLWLPWLFPLLGILHFSAMKLRKHLISKPQKFKVVEFEVIDVQREYRESLYSAGPYFRLTKFPGNQQLTCELNRKQMLLSRLPAEFDRLRLLHISDLHFVGTIRKEFFQHLLQQTNRWQPDLVVFTGDLLDSMDCLEWLPDTLGRLTARLGCYYILGNHDWHQQPETIRAELDRLGWKNCQGQLQWIIQSGKRICLGGDERPWLGAAADFSDTNPADFRILLSHTPDHISWARRQQVDLMLSGHNHGGQIRLPFIGPVFAPSRYGVLFADGEFLLPPTTLHISRGLAGRHPLRIRCRPELTLLELRCENR